MAEASLSNVSSLFKIKYGPLSANTYNSANVILARIKKSYDFVGKQMDVAIPLSFSGGVGSGSLPTPDFETVSTATLSAKKVYAVTQIEREAIKAASKSEGAFVQETKHRVQKTVESWMRNSSRILFGNGDGSLGTFSGNQSGTATAPVVTLVSPKWANFEERDYVNVNSDASVFRITSVSESGGTVTLARLSGSLDLTMIGAGTHTIYMQNSKDNDPNGLKQVCDATSSTLYGVSVGRRWQSTQIAAGGAGITVDLLNQGILEVTRKSGKTPNMCVMSYVQYRKYLNLLEDAKQYIVEPRSPELVGKVSFKAIELATPAGPVPVIAERFVEDDRVYLLNDNYIEAHHRPDFGWFDDDGTVFLRVSGSDSYSAIYGGYYQNFIVPTFQGVITGLAT